MSFTPPARQARIGSTQPAGTTRASRRSSEPDARLMRSGRRKPPQCMECMRRTCHTGAQARWSHSKTPRPPCGLFAGQTGCRRVELRALRRPRSAERIRTPGLLRRDFPTGTRRQSTAFEHIRTIGCHGRRVRHTAQVVARAARTGVDMAQDGWFACVCTTHHSSPPPSGGRLREPEGSRRARSGRGPRRPRGPGAAWCGWRRSCRTRLASCRRPRRRGRSRGWRAVR